MVCFHTGFAQRLLEMKQDPDPKSAARRLHSARRARHAVAGLDFIERLAVLIADNYAVEAVPAGPAPNACCSTLPLHEHCLFKNGIHLGELWHLTPLAVGCGRMAVHASS